LGAETASRDKNPQALSVSAGIKPYMATFPFKLRIDCISSDKGAESVLCREYLRVVPGRREVYDGVWDGRSVVVKVFSRAIGAAGRLRKELQGLHWLESCGVNTPKLLFYGKTSDGRFAVVTEKIADSSTVMDVFEKAGTKAEQADLLMRLCRELASQHTKGLPCWMERRYTHSIRARFVFLPGPWTEPGAFHCWLCWRGAYPPTILNPSPVSPVSISPCAAGVSRRMTRQDCGNR